MTDAAALTRRFSVHVCHISHHARVVEEPSFEAAAVAFMEHFPPTLADDSEIKVIVRDLESGLEHCYRVDLESGDTAPCG